MTVSVLEPTLEERIMEYWAHYCFEGDNQPPSDQRKLKVEDIADARRRAPKGAVAFWFCAVEETHWSDGSVHRSKEIGPIKRYIVALPLEVSA